MFQLVRAAYEPSRILVDKSFLRKTAQLVQETHRTSLIIEPDKTHQAHRRAGPGEAGRDEDTSDTVKVFNLVKALGALVEQQGWRRRTSSPSASARNRLPGPLRSGSSTQEALEQLQELVQEYREADHAPHGQRPLDRGLCRLLAVEARGVARGRGGGPRD